MTHNKSTYIFITAAAIALILFILVARELFSVNRIEAALKQQSATLEEYKNFIELYEDNKSRFKAVDEEEISAVVSELTDVGSSSHVDFISIEAKVIKQAKGQGFLRLPILIQATSSYKQVGDFLNALTALKSGAVVIDEMEIERDVSIAPRVRSTIIAEVILDVNNDDQR